MRAHRKTGRFKSNQNFQQKNGIDTSCPYETTLQHNRAPTLDVDSCCWNPCSIIPHYCIQFKLRQNYWKLNMFAVFLNNFLPSCNNFYQSIKSPTRTLVDNTSSKSKEEREPSKPCLFGFHYMMRMGTQPFAPPNKSTGSKLYIPDLHHQQLGPSAQNILLVLLRHPPKMVVPMPTAYFGKRRRTSTTTTTASNSSSSSSVAPQIAFSLMYITFTFVPIVMPLREENTACQHLPVFLDSLDWECTVWFQWE